MEPRIRTSGPITGRAAGRATLVATLTAPPSPADLAALDGVDCLEVRADLVGDLDPGPLRERFSGRLLYTLRSRAEGGSFEGSPERRRRRLLDAAGRFDLVDLEAERDAVPEVLRSIPPEQRILSWHGGPSTPSALQARFGRMAPVAARLYKLVPAAVQPGEELASLMLLQTLKRHDVLCFATGPGGAWTRLVAPRLGAAVVYGSAGEVPGAPGQMSIRRLREDYGLPDLPPVEAVFGIVGNPVAHSLSPRLHNGAYRVLGLPYLYLPFHAAAFGELWLEVVESEVFDDIGMPLRGLSVTAPHKQAALAVAGAASPLAELIGAANTLVWNAGVWEAESTDPEGVVRPLIERGIDPAGRRAVVVGAGGAGRSAAVGLACAGAEVALANRSAERGERVAAALKLPFLPLDGLDLSRFDLVVHATSLGRAEDDPLPFDLGGVGPGTVVIDLVYGDGPTRLIAAAEARGAVVVDGREVLLFQAIGQFRRMTGRDLPAELGRALLGLPAAGAASRSGSSPVPGSSAASGSGEDLAR